MPDSIAHAVGIDRQELLAREAGDDVSGFFKGIVLKGETRDEIIK